MRCKIIEVSGAPASGKTTFIERNFSDQFVLLGGMPLSYQPTQRIVYSIFLSCYAIATGSISLGQIEWLVKKSIVYDETIFARLNALRNSITKFGYCFFKAHARNKLIIDEGISHIPFILGLEQTDIYDFIDLFYKQLTSVSIIFIETPTRDVLIQRIATRGHKRVRNPQGIEEFVDRNSRIADQYKRALLGSYLNVTFKQMDNVKDI